MKMKKIHIQIDKLVNFEIVLFADFEEASEANVKAKANLRPEIHLANVTKRIKLIYAEELKKPMDKTLHFKKEDYLG